MLDILLQNIEDINTLEKAIMELACNLMEEALKTLEEELFKDKPDYLEVIHFKERTIATKLGEITYKRRYYRDKRTGNKLYLLDKKLGIRKRRRANGEFLKLLVTLADKLTFRQAEEVIKDAGFPSLSHQTIHKEVREFGERESKLIKDKKERVFTEGQKIKEGEKDNPDILFIEADGVMVSSQEQEEKRMEIKVGLVYEGWGYCTPARKRKKLIKPRVISGVYDGAEEFWEEFSTELARYYELEGTKIVLNGDGARWIQEKGKEYFPEIIVQLDRFHIKKDISTTFGKEVADNMYHILQRGDKKTFLDTLESLICEGETAELRRKRRSLVRHYKKNEDHLLDYRKRLPDGIEKKDLSGMGAIESYVDKVIARRMKNQGMSWSRKGAEAMARILMLRQLDKLKKRLSDEYYTIKNPIKKLKRRTKKKKRDWSQWLKASLPALRGPDSGKDWVKALNSITSV
ncbi:MAG: ISLre2 family transposase [Bacteroidales bacterium]